MNLLRILRNQARWIPTISGLALVAVSILISVDVLTRRFFNISVVGAGEIAGYVLAVISTWGFAYAAVVNAHIRIDSLIGLLPRQLRGLLGLIAQASLFGLGLFLAYHAWGVLEFSLERGSRSQTPLQVPLAIPQAIWFAGIVAFAITTLLIAFAGIRFALRRDWRSLAAHVESSDAEVASLELAGDRKDIQ